MKSRISVTGEFEYNIFTMNSILNHGCISSVTIDNKIGFELARILVREGNAI